MGVKISELSELTSIDNDDKLIINHGSQTYQGSLNTIIGDYLSNYSNENNYYITADNLGSYLYGNIDGSGYLSNYVTSNDLDSYITESYLNENSYITENYLSNNKYIYNGNLSDFLFGFSGYLSEIYYNDGTVNFEAIYNGISSYFET